MKFKQWLYNEMPLASYRTKLLPPTTTDKDAAMPSGQGEFNLIDRNLLTRPKTAQQLERVLNQHDYKFNILAYEGPGKEPITHPIRPKQDKFKEEVERWLVANGIQKEGHITFVKNSSSGDPLTPWMLLHTMGHALFDNHRGLETRTQITNIFNELLRTHVGTYYSPEEVDDIIFNTINRSVIPNFAARLLQFRSAKHSVLHTGKKSIPDESELVYELVAEYLWKGKVRLKVNPPLSVTTGGTRLIRLLDMKEIKIDQATLDEKAKEIEIHIKNALDRTVGKVIYDYMVG